MSATFNFQLNDLAAIGIVSVIVGIMAGGVIGVPLWQVGSVIGLVFVSLVAARFVGGWRAASDLRARRDIRINENNRCKRCDGDLWGLDVKPGKGGKYEIKCGECGTVNVIARPKHKKVKQERKKAQFEDVDRGPFKFPP